MKLRVPPPVVTATCGLLMWLVARHVPLAHFAFDAQQVMALAFVTAGGLLMSIAAWQFQRARTTINPMKPGNASTLVTNGVFAVSRNPIYVADLLFLIAVGLWFGSALSFLWLPVFVVYMNRFQIVPEEEALARLFGGDYLVYRARVRRWI